MNSEDLRGDGTGGGREGKKVSNGRQDAVGGGAGGKGVEEEVLVQAGEEA